MSSYRGLSKKEPQNITFDSFVFHCFGPIIGQLIIKRKLHKCKVDQKVITLPILLVFMPLPISSYSSC